MATTTEHLFDVQESSHSRSKHQASSRLQCVSREYLALSSGTDLQVQFKRHSCSFSIQRWYASPFKYIARLATHRAWPNPSFKRTCLRQAA